jgi:hypothetical protein
VWELIVMGQVPGTQFEVNFNTWLMAVVGMTALCLLYVVAWSWPHSRRVAMRRISRIMSDALDDAAPLLATRHHIQA